MAVIFLIIKAEMEAQRGHALWQCLMAIPGQPEVPSCLQFLTEEPKRIVVRYAAIVGYMTITTSSKREGVQGFFNSPKNDQLGFSLLTTAALCELQPRSKQALC